MDISHHAGALFASLVRVEERITLEPKLKHLVKLRASQINGCAFCVDMHHDEAVKDGESTFRLQQLAVWAESPAFDDRERAALRLTEAVTLLAQTHVPDDVYAEAQEHFDDDELAQLIFAIAAINTWNRIAVTTRAQPAGAARQAA